MRFVLSIREEKMGKPRKVESTVGKGAKNECLYLLRIEGQTAAE